ncbi:hypothetical protein ABIA35_009627 [Catenulispora sp. MAP12-49]|uniref:nucleotidyl transferase AbiEii/AbiGii toxin family protein n=1 Tax=Catenulispora sp. MAP12-49 TaxID=3156302 RepID=UPI0035188DCD
MEDPGPSRDRDTRHRLALDHVLGLIAGAGWSSCLVLRGSMLMTAYAGSAARKPGDLDFIVIKDGWPAEGAAFEDLYRLIRENSRVGAGVVLEAEQFGDSGDWTYVDYTMRGTRLTVPWRVEGTEGTEGTGSTEGTEGTDVCGTVQMDFAMDEPMPALPSWTRIPRLDGGFSVLLAASAELSLVWKLMWLMEDSKEGISRGKDLYDAVVLAELDPLREGIRAGGSAQAGLRRRDVEGWEVAWNAFVAENPEVQGSLEQWKQRLVDALGLA